MDENKNGNVKNIIVGVIIIGIVATIVVCFLLAYNNINSAKINSAENTAPNSISNENNFNNKKERNSNFNTNENKNTENTTETEVIVVDDSNLEKMNITSGGSYDLSGEYGSITIDTEKDVILNLKDASISSSNGPAINVIEAGKVTINLSGENKVIANTTEDLNGAIYSKADLVFSGTGSLEVKSNYDGIVSKDTLVIKNGTYTINSGDDGIRGKDSVEIENGTFTINAGGDGIKGITKVIISGGTFNISASEGIEATYVKIDDGTINISASDDGINASNKSTVSTPTVEINGGNITIKMGQGDTDGVDSNGDIVINGGTISVTGQSTFDYEGTGKINGGTVICNGEEVTTLPNQFMGGGMNGGPGGMNPGDRMNPNSGMNFPDNMNQNDRMDGFKQNRRQGGGNY